MNYITVVVLCLAASAMTLLMHEHEASTRHRPVVDVRVTAPLGHSPASGTIETVRSRTISSSVGTR